MCGKLGEAVALVIQFIVTTSDEQAEHPARSSQDDESANLIMFEDDSDIYDLTVSDDFLENIDVSVSQTSVDASLENYDVMSWICCQMKICLVRQSQN